MANQQYEQATVFNARAVDMRHLWTPSTEYKGKKQDKPSYFGSFIVPKTQAQWHLEPQLGGLVQAFSRIMQRAQISGFPIVDGDLPNAETGKHSEWARGHWLFSGNTSNSAPNIELVQAGGQLVKLTNKVGVKSGDYCMVGVSCAQKQNDARSIKLFLNAVVFTAPGEEIVFANSVSGAELMQMAQQQGLQIAGFAPSPGGFTQPQGGGFGAPLVQSNPGFGPAPQPGPGGFGQPQPQQQWQQPQPNPGQFQPQGAPAPFGAPAGPNPGYAPTTGAPAFGAPAPGPNGMQPNGFGGAASHFNPGPAPQQPNGWPQR